MITKAIEITKLAYKLSPAICALIAVLSILLAYNYYQTEQKTKSELMKLTNKLNQFTQKQIKDNEVIRQNEIAKISLENKSIEL